MRVRKTRGPLWKRERLRGEAIEEGLAGFGAGHVGLEKIEKNEEVKGER